MAVPAWSPASSWETRRARSSSAVRVIFTSARRLRKDGSGTTNSAGTYETGYVVPTTSLTVQVTYSGQTRFFAVTPQAGAVSEVAFAF